MFFAASPEAPRGNDVQHPPDVASAERRPFLQPRAGGGGGGGGAVAAVLAAGAEPVKLTPSWEESNLPNDELNFRGVTMEQADLEMNPPRDR